MSRVRETVSERVIERVATSTSRDALSLPPLYSSIDPDALDALVAEMSNGEVTFRYAGCDITVQNDGTITVA